MPIRILKDIDGNSLDDLHLAIQRGVVPSSSIVWKFGYHAASGTAIETIWDGDGLYVYHLGLGVDAKQVDIVSSSASDTVDIAVNGLDSLGNEITEIITLTGTTPATSINTFSRIFRSWNSNGTPFVGEVEVSETGVASNTLAIIHPDDQQTLMSIYTIPLGYSGYVFKGTANIGSGKEAVITYTIRLNGGVFRTQEKLPIYQNEIEADRPYNRLPALTDIEVRAKAVQSGNIIGATIGILLVKDEF